MNILLIDQDRCGLDFVLRCQEAGHAVKWFRPTDKPVKDGKGMGVEIVTSWKDHMPWAKRGLILCTANNKYIRELDQFRAFNFPIFGPTQASADLEIKRSLGMELFKRAGLMVPEYKEFKTLEEARAHVLKTDQAWVFKTLGDEEDKSLSYVASGEDPACDMWNRINHWIEAGMKLKGPCMLQEKVDMLAEMGVSGWMGPGGFLPNKWNENFEHKKLMPGDYGPNTGEQGTIIQYTRVSALAKDVLEPLERELIDLGHTGDFDVNLGVTTKGDVMPFEPTCRLGWPHFYGAVASHIGDPAMWMQDLLRGHDSLKVRYDCCCVMVVSQKPYPYDEGEPDQVEGNVIGGFDKVRKNLHPVHVMMGRGMTRGPKGMVLGQVAMTTGPYILVADGFGKTITRANEACLKIVDELQIPDKIVRDDIGLGLEDKLDELHQHGLAEAFTF